LCVYCSRYTGESQSRGKIEGEIKRKAEEDTKRKTQGRKDIRRQDIGIKHI
jgi:hypothetical protein